VLLAPLDNRRNGLVGDFRQRPDGLLDEVAQPIRERGHQNQKQHDREPLAPALHEMELGQREVPKERHEQRRRQMKASQQDERPQHEPI
jgi:hypothetical protein